MACLVPSTGWADRYRAPGTAEVEINSEAPKKIEASTI
jgi:hypothetical protein